MHISENQTCNLLYQNLKETKNFHTCQALRPANNQETIQTAFSPLIQVFSSPELASEPME